MKKIISVLLAAFLILAVSVTAFAAGTVESKTVTDVPGTADMTITLNADITPGYKSLVKDGKATIEGPGFTAVDENPPENAYRLVVIPIDDEEAIKWFDGCAKSPWESTGTFYSVFYEDAKGEEIAATGVKMTIQIPDGFKNLKVYSLNPDEKGEFINQPQILGTSVTVTTNGRLYYGVVHGEGLVNEQTSTGSGAPETTLDMTSDELADAVLTDEEKNSVKDGIDVNIKLSVENISDTVSSSDKEAVESVANGYTVGEYIDVELLKQIGSSEWTNVRETKKPIRITVNIPKGLLGVDGRTFAIARVHNGKAELLKDLDNDPDTITFETSEFSTYSILYRDSSTSDKPPQTGLKSFLGLWLLAMSASLTVFGLVLFLRRGKKRNSSF